MPYFVIEEKSIDGFVGFALTIGWMPEVKDFHIALTIGKYTIAIGLDFYF